MINETAILIFLQALRVDNECQRETLFVCVRLYGYLNSFHRVGHGIS